VQRGLGERHVERGGLRTYREGPGDALGLASEFVRRRRLSAQQREARRPAECPGVTRHVIAARPGVDHRAGETFRGLEVTERDPCVGGERRDVGMHGRIVDLGKSVERAAEPSGEHVGPAGPDRCGDERRRAVRRRTREQFLDTRRIDALTTSEVGLHPLHARLEGERVVAARIRRAYRLGERGTPVVAARLRQQAVDERDELWRSGARGAHARQRAAHALDQTRRDRSACPRRNDSSAAASRARSRWNTAGRKRFAAA
jgi:hypothetical protein